jgi:hypothetical protein
MPSPIGDGLATNLQDLGGNVTGVTTFDPQQARTQLGFLSRRIGRYGAHHCRQFGANWGVLLYPR